MRAVTMQRAALNHRFAHEPGCDHAEPRTRFDVLVKTSEAFKMKDTIDRRAALGALTNVPGGIPVVAMATPVDPIFTAIERDRMAYVGFATSLNKTDGRKAAQEKNREVTQTDEDAYVAASGVGEDAVSESTGDGVWRQS
jgi:hypothetical protein